MMLDLSPAMVGVITLAINSLVIVLMAWITRVIAKQSTVIENLEKNTNSIKDALVASTRAAGLAEGRAAGVMEGKAIGAEQAAGVAAGVVEGRTQAKDERAPSHSGSEATFTVDSGALSGAITPGGNERKR